MGGEGARVDPVEACAGGGVDFARGGEEGAGGGLVGFLRRVCGFRGEGRRGRGR